MVRPRLAIVAGIDPALDRSRNRGLVAGIGITLLALAGLATLSGADEARRSFNPREFATTILDTALEHGSDAPEVRGALVAMRSTIAHRPLDTKTRVAFSTAMLGVARTIDDLEVAAFHARLAARLTPVTVPVVRGSAIVLLNTGHSDESLALIRAMFGYDPGAASRLLALSEPLLLPNQVEQGVADAPEAWQAWARQLRQIGRAEEAGLWFERGLERWPEDLRLLVQVAEQTSKARDWEKLDDLLRGRTLPDEPGAALLYVHRARLHVQAGNLDDAASDLTTALRLASRSTSVHLRAGDTYMAMGAADEARRSWNRALFLLEQGQDDPRSRVLRRLARLEEAQGRHGTALRQWRAVLNLDPDDEEAQRRVTALAGSSP